MKTRLAVVLIVLSQAVGLHAQGAPVSLSSGDPITYLSITQNASAAVDNLARSVQVVQNGIDALRAQAQMVEALQQGDWNGFMQAFSYQIDAIDSTNEAIQNYNSFWPEDEQNAGMVSFSETLTKTSQTMRMQRNILQSMTSLVRNSRDRFVAGQAMAEQQKNSQSQVQQLQLAGQQASLIQGELADVKSVLYYNMIYAQSMEAERQAQIRAATDQALRNTSNTNTHQLFASPNSHEVF